MAKRKKPKSKSKYVPGATWQDVLKNKPVVRGERHARKRARPKPVVYRCRDCPAGYTSARRTGVVRCAACGGIMDPAPR